MWTTSQRMLQIGESLARKALGVKPVQISRTRLAVWLERQGFRAGQFSLPDRKYYLADWETWKKIISWDWANKRKWVEDWHDCDNFAFYFASRMPWIFGLNSAGVAFGTVYWAKNNRAIGGHAFNVIFCLNEKNKLEMYVYEPMNDLFCKFEKGKKVVLGPWRYKINWIYCG